MSQPGFPQMDHVRAISIKILEPPKSVILPTLVDIAAPARSRTTSERLNFTPYFFRSPLSV